MNAKKTANNYKADAIQTLDGIEAVRKRPGMYIGGTGSDGLTHLVSELIDNGVDEAAAGHAKTITVTFHRDRSVEVADDGRGIPIGMHAKRKVTALEVVFTELHAGGKFGGGAYGASAGLHGVGASVVNALSSKLIVEVDRDGYTHRLGFNERVAGQFDRSAFKKTHQLEKVKKISANKTGTRVRFWPDWELFDAEASVMFETVRERVRRSTYLVPGLRVNLIDKRSDANLEESFVSRGGLKDLVEDTSTSGAVKGEALTRVIELHGSDTFEEKVPVNGKMTKVERVCTVDIALRWVSSFDTSVSSYVNTVPTPEGGTHLNGFERALTRAVNDTLLTGMRKLAKLARKNKDRATKDDISEGLIAAVKVTVPEPQFRGQTKRELGTPAVQSIVYEVTKTALVAWFETEGPKTHVDALRNKVADAVISRVASRQMLENKRKASSLGSAALPAKLLDCRQHGPDSELIIVEGDSAAGPAKAGRDSATMAVLPLRGKLINAEKASVKQVLDNAEAKALFTAIGAGSGADFDIDSARYGRIVILCDADVDGSHIRCLLLTLINRYMRPMLEAGRVYAAQPPLFTTKVADKNYRAFSDEERDAISKSLAKGKRSADSIRWQRFKGLGEMNVDELASAALDPKTRILKRLTIEDAKQAAEAAEMFQVLMGNDVASRRNYVVENSTIFDRESLDV